MLSNFLGVRPEQNLRELPYPISSYRKLKEPRGLRIGESEISVIFAIAGQAKEPFSPLVLFALPFALCLAYELQHLTLMGHLSCQCRRLGCRALAFCTLFRLTASHFSISAIGLPSTCKR